MSNTHESPEEKNKRESGEKLRAKYQELMGGVILQDTLENESTPHAEKSTKPNPKEQQFK